MPDKADECCCPCDCCPDHFPQYMAVTFSNVNPITCQDCEKFNTYQAGLSKIPCAGCGWYAFHICEPNGMMVCGLHLVQFGISCEMVDGVQTNKSGLLVQIDGADIYWEKSSGASGCNGSWSFSSGDIVYVRGNLPCGFQNASITIAAADSYPCS